MRCNNAIDNFKISFFMQYFNLFEQIYQLLLLKKLMLLVEGSKIRKIHAKEGRF